MAVDGMRGGIDIGEDRPDLLPLESVSGRDKGKGRNDHFALEVEGASCNLQPYGAVGGRNGVPDAEKGSQALLEFAHKRPLVGKPPAIEHLLDAFQQAGTRADIGAANVERLGKRRSSAEQRQAVSGLLVENRT